MIRHSQVHVHEVTAVLLLHFVDKIWVVGVELWVDVLPLLNGRQTETLADSVVVRQSVVPPPHDVQRA